MPRYEYSDPETGITVEVHRKVEDRNKPIVLRRINTAPRSIGITGLGPTPDQEYNQHVLAGWHKQEELHGSRLDTGEFTKDQIKKIWSE